MARAARRGVAQPGAVWLAKATGNPVLPFHIEADRHWTLGSWDRTQIPKPFAIAALVVGEPIDVPRRRRSGDRARLRLLLEERLAALDGARRRWCHHEANSLSIRPINDQITRC